MALEGLDLPVAKKGVAEQVTQRVLALIQSGVLKPGDRLPAERELAAQLGVGRPSLREALRALSLLGVLDIRQGDGVRVAALSPERLLQPLHFLVSLEADNLDMLFEARAVLEAGLTRLAAEHLSETDLEQLKHYVDQGETVLDDPEAFLELDVAFHKVITEAAGNALLRQIVQSLGVLTRASRSLTVNLPGVRVRSHEDHTAIYQALFARDVEAAGRAMQRHLEQVQGAYNRQKEER